MAGRGSVRGSGRGGRIRVRWGDGGAERGGDRGRADIALGEKKSTKEEPVPVHGARGMKERGAWRRRWAGRRRLVGEIDRCGAMVDEASLGGRDRPRRSQGRVGTSVGGETLNFL